MARSDFSPDIDMAGWVFAFGVSLGSINLDDGTDESNEIRGVINQPGDYSISRLYLDFNSEYSLIGRLIARN
jgi:hypothetical protein